MAFFIDVVLNKQKGIIICNRDLQWMRYGNNVVFDGIFDQYLKGHWKQSPEYEVPLGEPVTLNNAATSIDFEPRN